MIYVIMTDTFMSGWGRAHGRTNKYVVACKTQEQADTVVRNAKKRREMKDIRTVTSEPVSSRGIYVSSITYDELGDIWKK